MYESLNKLHQCVINGILDPLIIEAAQRNLNFIGECEVLDFKQQLPVSTYEYAKITRDLIAMHNSYGGFLVFGIREIDKDRTFEIIGIANEKINIAKIRDLIKSYTGSELRIHANSVAINGKNLDILFIAKRGKNENPVKFIRNGPEEKPGKLCFKKGDVVFREIQTNSLAELSDHYEFLYSPRHPPSIELSIKEFNENSPLEHNLPDRSLVCSKFIGRLEILGDLWTWLADDFSRVRLIAGEGGLGKTSLAYRFAEAVASVRVKPFEKVVWLTAKKDSLSRLKTLIAITIRSTLKMPFRCSKQ